MRKLIYLILCAAAIFSTAFNSSKPSKPDGEVGEWTKWYESDCYDGIYYRYYVEEIPSRGYDIRVEMQNKRSEGKIMRIDWDVKSGSKKSSGYETNLGSGSKREISTIVGTSSTNCEVEFSDLSFQKGVELGCEKW